MHIICLKGWPVAIFEISYPIGYSGHERVKLEKKLRHKVLIYNGQNFLNINKTYEIDIELWRYMFTGTAL